MTDAEGDTAWQVVYDGYGAVLTGTMPVTLTHTLLDMPDGTTGLVHLGNGRYYDPALGRPLQSNPAGAPPTVPQALNRYAATALGQPGVFQATQSTWNPFRDDYLSNIGKGVVSNQLEDLTTVGLRRYYRASLYTVIGDPIIETLTIAVSKNTNVERYIVTAPRCGEVFLF